MMEWIQVHEAWLWWLAALSLLLFIGTLLAVPWLVIRIPRDYFTRLKSPPRHWLLRHPMVGPWLLVIKNLLGLILILAGLAMLVLPGQGLITLLVGLTFLDIPGKYRLECWLVERRPIWRSINWLRRRAGRPPLDARDTHTADPAPARHPPEQPRRSRYE